jgi:hypothetical protein
MGLPATPGVMAQRANEKKERKSLGDGDTPGSTGNLAVSRSGRADLNTLRTGSLNI